MFVHQGRVSGALLLVASVSQLAVAQGPRATADEIARSVDSLAARVVSSGVSPALGVAIVMDGKTIFSKAYGFADATNRIAANDETLWYLASTSKSFTGFGVSLLATQGVLRFDAPISTLLVAPPGGDVVDTVTVNVDTRFCSASEFSANLHVM